MPLRFDQDRRRADDEQAVGVENPTPAMITVRRWNLLIGASLSRSVTVFCASPKQGIRADCRPWAELAELVSPDSR